MSTSVIQDMIGPTNEDIASLREYVSGAVDDILESVDSLRKRLHELKYISSERLDKMQERLDKWGSR